MVQEWAWNTVDEEKHMLGEDEFVVKALDWCLGEFDFHSSFNRDFLYDL